MKGEGNEHEGCECHEYIGDTLTCNMECFKCSGASEVIVTKTKDGTIKREIIFDHE